MLRKAVARLFDEEKDPAQSSSGRRSTRTWRLRPIAAKTSPTSSRASSSRTPDRHLTGIAEVDLIWIIVVLTVVVAFAFDVINGFHDAANSIATIVSTRVLRPRYAVLWAAFFNFVAMFIFAPRVADTMSKIVDVKAEDTSYVWVVLAGLIGAMSGTSDLVVGHSDELSHALIGASRIRVAPRVSTCSTGTRSSSRRVLPLATLIGMVAAVLLMASRLDLPSLDSRVGGRLLPESQFISAALYSLGHGGNDAQKTMGIIVPCSWPPVHES